MQITIDTEKPLSQSDQNLLAVLIGVADGAAPKSEVVTEPAKATPSAAKAAPAKPAPAKPTPEPEPAEDEDDDLIGGAKEVTLEEVVTLATSMASKGQAPKIKAALVEVGAKRVKEVPEDKLQEFHALLTA